MGNNKSITTSNRLIHYDLMRVLACFCVIVIHIGICDDNPTNGAFSIDSSFSSLYSIVARWAVPCFLMVSGVMFLDKNKDIPIKKLYVKYIFRLAVSYVFWSCIYALYNSFYDAGDSFIEKFKYFASYCLSGELHTWYILVTIGIYMTLPIIKHLINTLDEKKLRYWILMMFIFFSIVPFVSSLSIPMFPGYVAYINKYMELYFFAGYMFYFVIGYYLFSHDISAKIKKCIYSLSVVGFVYSVIVLCLFNPLFGFKIGVLGYSNPNIVFMSMGVFLFFTDVVSKHKFSNKFKRVITSLSGLTYGIYLIHVLILKVLHNMGVSLSFCAKSVSILIISLITFIFAAIIVYIMKKVPLVGKYLC